MMDQEVFRHQQKLWNRQHAQRGRAIDGECGTALQNTPNQTAVVFSEYFPKKAHILEVGCANGRDARYWARLGHQITAVDFSSVAIQQLRGAAESQGVQNHITPVLSDVSTGTLPFSKPEVFDAFYARSALHISDNAMKRLVREIDTLLKPHGVILMEGKGPQDQKIARSEKFDNNLVVDSKENGHLRRVWTRELAEGMCRGIGWNILSLTNIEEEWQGTPAAFLRVIARKE